MYNSIGEIQKDFELEFHDVGNLRDSLNSLRIELHPDKNNGDFKNESDKEKFLKLNAAIQYIDSIKNDNQIIAVERMTELIKAITELIPNSTQTTLQNNLDLRIGNAIGQYRSKLYVPKISLTAITGVMTFLFAVPAQLKDNAVLSRFLNPQNPTFVLMWLIMLFYTGAFWLITFMNEEKAKRQLSLLKVDATQNELFDKFVMQLSSLDFSKDELTEYIFNQHTRANKSILLFSSDIITMEVAQSISELIINRAEKKGLIGTNVSKSLSDRYTFKS